MKHFQSWWRNQILAMWRYLFPWRRFVMRDWWAVVLWPIRRSNITGEPRPASGRSAQADGSDTGSCLSASKETEK